MNKIKIIAEVCSNHNNNIERCFKLIDSAKKIGCYAVKFQLFRLDKLFHSSFIKKNKLYKLKKRELDLNFIPKLSAYCKKKKIKFGCTPFDLESVDQLAPYVDFFKISSYEILWKDLLLKVINKKKQTIISTGMTNEKEFKETIKIVNNVLNKKKIVFLHCVSSYPAKINECNLNSIPYLKRKYKFQIGWSDHTVSPLLIYKLYKQYDVRLFELHFDLDGKGWEFKDSKHCWLPNDINNLIGFINNEKKIEGRYHKQPSLSEHTERLYRTDPIDGLRPNIKKRF
jgi:sialic acid synthase SpsE